MLASLVVATVLLQVPSPQVRDNFPDVPDNHWAYEMVEVFKKEGFIKGYPDRLSRGAWPLSRAEFAQFTLVISNNIRGHCVIWSQKLADEKRVLGCMELRDMQSNAGLPFREQVLALATIFESEIRALRTSPVALRAMIRANPAPASFEAECEARLAKLGATPVIKDPRAYLMLDEVSFDFSNSDYLSHYQFDRRASKKELALTTIDIVEKVLPTLKALSEELLRDLRRPGYDPDQEYLSERAAMYKGVRWRKPIDQMVDKWSGEIKKAGKDPVALKKVLDENQPLVDLCRRRYLDLMNRIPLNASR